MGVAMMNSNLLEDEWEYDVDDGMDYFNDLFVYLWQNAQRRELGSTHGTLTLL